MGVGLDYVTPTWGNGIPFGVMTFQLEKQRPIWSNALPSPQITLKAGRHMTMVPGFYNLTDMLGDCDNQHNPAGDKGNAADRCDGAEDADLR